MVSIAYFLMLALFASAAAGAAWSTYEGLRSYSYVEVVGIVAERSIGLWSGGSYLLVGYRYVVGGVEYEGNRIEAGTFGFPDSGNVTRLIMRVRVGEPVPVYVDPDNPSMAVLERGLSGITIKVYVLAAFLGFATLFLRVFHLALRMRPTPEKRKAPVFGRQPRS